MIAVLFAFLPQGAVHVVDASGGPGADFTELSAAVLAAAAGDVLLVRGGTYDSFVLTGKSLSVVAERGATVRALAATVVDLAAAGALLIQGVHFESNAITGEFRRNAGPTWLERCAFVANASPNGSGGPIVVDCGAFVAARSEMVAAPILGGLFAVQGQRSRLHLHGCSVRGQTANDFGLGLVALTLESGELELFGSSVIGADGFGGSPFMPDGGDGGDALGLHAGSHARILDSSLRGGVGGTPFGTGLPGEDGAGIAGPGTTELLPGQEKELELTSPVREGQVVTVTVHGKPGDEVWVWYAPSPGLGRAITGLTGEFLLPATHRRGIRATIPAGGVLVRSFPAPQLRPGSESQVFYAQATVRDVQSRRFIASSPSALVVLDDAL